MEMNEMDINKDPNYKEEEKASEEKEEVMQYINFKKQFKQSRELYTTRYIINKEWFNKWKAKMNYRKYRPQVYQHYYRRNEIDSLEGDLPKINNEPLIIDPSTYLRTSDDKNHVINSEALRDLKYVNEEVWTMLVDKYKGGPEIKLTIPPGFHENQINDLFCIKVTFIILPLKSELLLSPSSREKIIENIKEYNIYCEKMETLEYIKKKIGRVIIDNKILGESSLITNLADDNTRLWLKDDDVTIQSIQEEYKQCVEIIEKDRNAMLDISNRFGIKCLEGFMMAKMCSLFGKKEELLFCFEMKTDSSPFLFKNKESLKIDQCEFDRVNGLMTVCCQCGEVWYCNKLCLEKDKRFHESNCTKAFDLDDDSLVLSSSSINGLCGLSNLGNTCFMNTALQCLSNCPQLTEYFIGNKYKQHINEDNPLGTKGIMANAYANLLKNLWYGDHSVFTPSYFKRSLGKYLKMFSGFNQHDTQEFLNYLLDTLHEDLNKVIKKPIVERDDSDLPDEIKSNSHWVSFLRRNQSVLVDLLYGQFKSTLICPDRECGNISITFDPFLSISLPLVSKVKISSISCFFIFHDIKASPLFFKIPFYSDTTFMAFRNKLADMLNIHPWSFVIVKIEENRRIEELISETKPLHSMRTIESPKYFIYQIDPELFYSDLNASILNIKDSFIYQKEFEDSEEYLNSRKEITQNIYSKDYEETANNAIKDTSNNCMSTEFVSVVIKMMDYLEDHFIFPRVLFLHRKLSIKELYLYLFKTYCHILQYKKPNHITTYNDIDTKSENKTEEEMVNEFKNQLELITDNIEYEKAIETQSLPFHIVYISKDIHEQVSSIYPYQEGILEDYVTKFNEEQESYYYISNKLFSLGIIWGKNKKTQVVNTLNDYREPSIKIEEKDKAINIHECFTRFSKSEVLEGNNEWYCPKCKQHRRASKKIDIYKTPNVLIIHLKRFTNNSKLDTLIDFPIVDLDISKYVISKDEDTKYDLFAIGNHYGSMGFGHYISFAKNHLTGHWYEFDDSRVSRKEERDLVDSSAYVLFYAKKGINLINWNEIYDNPFVNYENQEEKKGETIKEEEEKIV